MDISDSSFWVRTVFFLAFWEWYSCQFHNLTACSAFAKSWFVNFPYRFDPGISFRSECNDLSEHFLTTEYQQPGNTVLIQQRQSFIAAILNQVASRSFRANRPGLNFSIQISSDNRRNLHAFVRHVSKASYEETKFTDDPGPKMLVRRGVKRIKRVQRHSSSTISVTFLLNYNQL